MTPEANDALSKAKVALMAAEDTVFYCVLMLGLEHIWDDSQPTAYTNGKVVGYNHKTFLQWTPDERVGVVLHETLHVGLLHIFRGVGLDHQKANRAADYVVNLIVKAAGFQLPQDCLYDTRYRDKSFEEVYALLPDEPDDKPNSCSCPGLGNDIRTPDDMSPEELAQFKDDVDDLLIQAVMQSRIQGDKPGSVPGDLERYVDALIKPELPWFRILKSLMTKFARDDYSYQRPNRRYLGRFILPGLYSEKICDIAIGEDISCSITKDQHDHFVAETGSVLKGLKPDKITFIQWDVVVQQVDELKQLRDLQRLRYKNGGGTDVNDLMKWAQKNKPACLIVFTDGEFSTPKIDPKVPVIWIIHGNYPFKVPFGKMIKYEFKGPRSI